MRNGPGTISKNNGESGFTLVETLVALSILILAVAAPLVFVSQSVSYGRSANDQATAIYLAQEAVELVRNERDRHSLTPGSLWSGFLSALGSPSSSCFSSSGCIVDILPQLVDPLTGLSITACSGACPVVTKNVSAGNARGIYSYQTGTGWQTTPFTRTVKVSSASPSGNEVKIQVTVSWQTGGPHQFTTTEHLYNWQR